MPATKGKLYVAISEDLRTAYVWHSEESEPSAIDEAFHIGSGDVFADDFNRVVNKISQPKDRRKIQSQVAEWAQDVCAGYVISLSYYVSGYGGPYGPWYDIASALQQTLPTDSGQPT